MNTQKVMCYLILAVCVVVIGIWWFERETGPDMVSQEIAEKLVFAKRDGVVYYEGDKPRSWSAMIIWPEGDAFQVSYIDEEIKDKGNTYQWREMSYIFTFPGDGQVAVSDADMDGSVDSLRVNGITIFHTEPGYADVNPQLRAKAQRVLEVFRAAALALALAPDGDLRDFVAPPGVPL